MQVFNSQLKSDCIEICEITLREKLIGEIKKSLLLERTQKDLAGLWSAVEFTNASVFLRENHQAIVHIDANISRFHPEISKEAPIEETRVELAIAMRYRRRTESHPMGIEIIRISDRNTGVLKGG